MVKISKMIIDKFLGQLNTFFISLYIASLLLFTALMNKVCTQQAKKVKVFNRKVTDEEMCFLKQRFTFIECNPNKKLNDY